MARIGGVLLVMAATTAFVGAPALPYAYIVAVVVWLASIHWGLDARLRWVLGVALLLRLPFFFGEFFSDDLFRYVWEGRIQWAGFSPFAHAPDDPVLAGLRTETFPQINHPGMTTIYPPLAQLLFLISTGLGLAETGLRNLVLLLDCGVVVLIAAWLKSTRRPAGWALLYSWAPLAVASSAAGHLDPLMLLCLVGFAWAWERGAFRRAALLLGLAVLAKTVAILILPWALLRRPRATLLVCLPVVLLGYLPYAPAGNLLGSLLQFGGEFAFNASLFRVADLLLPLGWARPLLAASLLAWIGLVVFLQPRVPHAVALILGGLLVCSPTVHFWYLTWILVMLPGIGRTRGILPAVAWAATISLAMGTYLRDYAGLGFEEDLRATALEYLPVAAVALWALVKSRPKREPLAAPDLGASGSFAVVIPAFRERACLAELLPRFARTPVLEVVVADTPSGDDTEELVRCSDRVRYLPVRERGYGAAVAAGLAEVRGVDFVVICDADHDRGPEQVERLLAPFRDPEVALVTGARLSGEGLTLPQRAGNGLATFLIAIGWGRYFHDLGPFRALRCGSLPLDTLRDRAFGWNVEMNVRALEAGLKVVEVALPPGRRRHGRNRISSTVRGVLGAGAGILRQIYRMREESCARPSSS